MQVSVERMSDIRRRISITVPAQKVAEAYQKSIKQYAKEVKMPGFRPGKVPISHIIQKFGPRIQSESLAQVMESEVQTILKKENLVPISQLTVENQPSLQNEGYHFIISFEVLPELTDIHFSMPEIEKLKVDISAVDIERVITQLQTQFVEWKTIDQPAEEKNRVIIDYSYQIANGPEKPNKVKDYSLELGSHVMIPGFEEGLLGAKSEEERTLELTIPNDSPLTDYAGQLMEFKVKIKQVFKGIFPELNEEFIKRLGIKSGQISDLRDQISQTLTNERDRLIAEKIKNQVFDHLLAQNAIEIPTVLVEREAERIHNEIHPNHENHTHSEEEMKPIRELARKRVSVGLMINKLIEKSALKADPEKIKHKIQNVASSYEHPEEVLNWFNSSEERLKGIEGQVLEDQVVEDLIKDVKVKEKEMSFAELKGITT